MKKLGLALVLVVCWVATASAARVYLKDGSWIDAKKVWREKGRVMVLVNRDTITSFGRDEINLKKTFPARKKKVKPVAAAASSPTPAPGGTAPAQAAAQPPQQGKKISLPSLPSKLPEREPPRLSSEEGAIRKQKKEMEKRLNE